MSRRCAGRCQFRGQCPKSSQWRSRNAWRSSAERGVPPSFVWVRHMRRTKDASAPLNRSTSALWRAKWRSSRCQGGRLLLLLVIGFSHANCRGTNPILEPDGTIRRALFPQEQSIHGKAGRAAAANFRGPTRACIGKPQCGAKRLLDEACRNGCRFPPFRGFTRMSPRRSFLPPCLPVTVATRRGRAQ